MSNKDEALKLALEALEKIGLRGWVERKEEAITAIRSVLDEHGEALAHSRSDVEQPAQQEPVAVRQFRKRGCSDWYDGHPDHTDGGGPYESRTLYTSPPASKPLTDEQISDLWDGHTVPVFGKTGINPIVFARAIEAAHGIKEK